MKLILLILIPFLSFSQQDLNDAKHFYGTVSVCELSYGIQPLIFKDQKPVNRFLLSIGSGLAVGYSKELFDKYRCNRSKRTGFDKLDLATDAWGVLCWIPFRICLNDFRQVGFVPRKNKNKYSIARDL